MGRRGSGRSQ
ncbi:hypothetical protein Zm00014a_020611 [Zea mays]|uniref:Uncharacterized protein n=1 Tax=Zea mays TaxID=4577 RepID=A0A317Y592_MAIZE|nr:hypothetical protein Zm00014a_020611 [Zea mays]